MLFCCGMASGQNLANPDQPYECYCVIHPYGFMKNALNKMRCEVSFPSSDSYIKLRDENGDVIVFRGEAELFSYMSKRGWEYVDTIVKNADFMYVMKKKVFKDEDALEHFIIKED